MQTHATNATCIKIIKSAKAYADKMPRISERRWIREDKRCIVWTEEQRTRIKMH